MPGSRIGVWMIGAKGGVATTAQVGLLALQQGLVSNTGLVSTDPQFAALDLIDWNQIVVGGHDIRSGSLFEEAARMLMGNRAVDASLLEKCRSGLQAIERNLRSGVIVNCGERIATLASDDLRQRVETPSKAIERIRQDYAEFVRANEISQLIVIHLGSTEPPVELSRLPQTWAEMQPLLDDAQACPLPPSSLYAIAAFEQGASFINFTPSLGATPAAIQELALLRKTRHAGFDGKTGETLLKSTLAPMFARRNLDVMSWVGHNIFGNLDGKVLDDPTNKQAKVASKDHLLREIFGYAPQTLVTIEYIESLGDWKTAWDHIHFRGFLGTPMTMQFTWQGCDSILAAPLVLDLIRFTERAARAGEVGVLRFLASFFKSPLDVEEHDFARQFQLLEAWTELVTAN